MCIYNIDKPDQPALVILVPPQSKQLSNRRANQNTRVTSLDSHSAQAVYSVV